MPMSDFLEDALLKLVLNDGTYTPPTSVWVALFTTDPTDGGTGTEVSGFGYARVQVTQGFLVTVAAATRAGNTAPIVFPPANGGAWGNVTHMGIFDLATGGNLLFHGALTTPRNVVDGSTFQFSSDQLGISLN